MREGHGLKVSAPQTAYQLQGKHSDSTVGKTESTLTG